MNGDLRISAFGVCRPPFFFTTMKGLLGEKLEMTQIFDETGTAYAVTAIQVGPCVVTQVKNAEKDGYTAVQVAWGNTKKPSKPRAGQTKDLPANKVLREFRFQADDKAMTEAKRGDVWKADVFTAGEKVDVIATSKGKGFAGVMKRHNFRGGAATHGQRHSAREPGSIASKRQGPVAKGQRMAGHMGVDRVTVKNLKVIQVDAEKGLVYVLGSVPGARHSLVQVIAR